ncbi:hypothetical protein EJM73_08865 [Clostridium botulinum]|uniref:hypothetical protein n=1 Tax=Clostridium botulinum TaxID=1491 RepID=UPI00137617B4|nr:hypothetical protein [Clostridium botulinum]NCI19735.1 hypothetical protein [Clostridium botulinum]NCI35773.1 hypothetical protein [Clostridium botulinum]NCI71630.1 hypothetical protein [Clostridium botulinum]NDI38822.1 hypothetical protein [Clostridium botulinum]
MNNLGEQINQVLNNLASKFGVTVDKLYPILRKQAQVELVKSIIGFIIGLILVIVVYKIWDKANKRRDRDMEEFEKEKSEHGFSSKEVYNLWDDEFGKSIIMIITLIIGVLAMWIEGSNIIQISINPDFYIAQTIMNMIKNIK